MEKRERGLPPIPPFPVELPAGDHRHAHRLIFLDLTSAPADEGGAATPINCGGASDHHYRLPTSHQPRAHRSAVEAARVPSSSLFSGESPAILLNRIQPEVRFIHSHHFRPSVLRDPLRLRAPPRITTQSRLPPPERLRNPRSKPPWPSSWPWRSAARSGLLRPFPSHLSLCSSPLLNPIFISSPRTSCNPLEMRFPPAVVCANSKPPNPIRQDLPQSLPPPGSFPSSECRREAWPLSPSHFSVISQ